MLSVQGLRELLPPTSPNLTLHRSPTTSQHIPSPSLLISPIFLFLVRTHRPKPAPRIGIKPPRPHRQHKPGASQRPPTAAARCATVDPGAKPQWLQPSSESGAPRAASSPSSELMKTSSPSPQLSHPLKHANLIVVLPSFNQIIYIKHYFVGVTVKNHIGHLDSKRPQVSSSTHCFSLESLSKKTVTSEEKIPRQSWKWMAPLLGIRNIVFHSGGRTSNSMRTLEGEYQKLAGKTCEDRPRERRGTKWFFCSILFDKKKWMMAILKSLHPYITI